MGYELFKRLTLVFFSRSILRQFAVLTTLFFILLPSHRTALAQPRPKPKLPVVFVVDTFPETVDRDVIAGFIIQDLEKQFPNLPILLVRGQSNEEVRRQLADQMHSRDTEVKGLYVISHGESWDNHDTALRNSKRYYSAINSLDGNFEVLLNRVDAKESSVASAFGPVIGRFAPDAKILFLGCETIKVGNEKEKAEIMSQVALNFGLKSGSVYMNQTLGSFAAETPIGLLKSDADTLAKAQYYGSQIYLPILVPGLSAFDHIFRNQGYSLVLKNGKSILYYDNRYNAAQSALPLGPTVATSAPRTPTCR